MTRLHCSSSAWGGLFLFPQSEQLSLSVYSLWYVLFILPIVYRRSNTKRITGLNGTLRSDIFLGNSRQTQYFLITAYEQFTCVPPPSSLSFTTFPYSKQRFYTPTMYITHIHFMFMSHILTRQTAVITDTCRIDSLSIFTF